MAFPFWSTTCHVVPQPQSEPEVVRKSGVKPQSIGFPSCKSWISEMQKSLSRPLTQSVTLISSTCTWRDGKRMSCVPIASLSEDVWNGFSMYVYISPEEAENNDTPVTRLLRLKISSDLL